MDAFLHAVQLSITLEALLAVVFGSVFGLIFGAIPGLTFSMALALILPITFSLESAAAMAMLVSTYIGGMTGGSVSSILLGIPGTPSSAATVLDGFPLARKGQASVALGTAVIVSVFGGIFSLLVMVFVADWVAKMAIGFGPVEIFALVLFGMSTICGLAEKSLLRGFIAGILGLMLTVVGLDSIEGIPRMTFGSVELIGGVNLVVAMIGLFAVPQVMITFLTSKEELAAMRLDGPVSVRLPSLRELKRHFWLMVRSALIGTGIGAIPGAGGPIAAFLSYDHARRFSNNTETFGEGELAGVVAPETANNAVTGGAMIPLLGLGIPGDPATAVMLGGLLIHGLSPGPMLFRSNISQVYAIYIGFFLSYLVVLVVQLFGIRLFVRVLNIHQHHLAVTILGMCGIGAYAIRNSIFDVYTMATLGLIGYVLTRLRIPVTPLVLGLVLGSIMETEYRTALTLSDGNHLTFFQSGVSLAFFLLAVLTTIWQVYSNIKNKGNAEAL